MQDYCREYDRWNRELGDSRLLGFMNENGVRGIETNGEPVYEGEEGFCEMWETLTPFTKEQENRFPPRFNQI